MKAEIVRNIGDLKREVWVFTLSVGIGSPCIYFDYYSFQTRESTRHRTWVRQTKWERLDRRSNNIDKTSIPEDVKSEMYSQFQSQIKELVIQC